MTLCRIHDVHIASQVVGILDADRDAPQLRSVSGQASWRTLRAGALPAALRPCRATAASARYRVPGARTPAQRRNDQRQARELEERAILSRLAGQLGRP